MQVASSIKDKFRAPVPIFFAGSNDTIKLEMKPYLQPFEEELAIRELRALVPRSNAITHEHGIYVVSTSESEELLRKRLTYWQRIGRDELVPTLQKALEFTQGGMESTSEMRGLHGSRRLRYGPHDLHEYRGKFFPQLVRSLINISGVSGDAIVLDPMCGSGTAPCEAIVAGRNALGADLNPLSVLVSTVKTSIVSESPECFLRTVEGYLESFKFGAVPVVNIWGEHDLTYLERWFSSAALNDIASILSEINHVDNSLYKNFFLVCLSNIIRSVSWQKEADLRVRKEIKPYAARQAVIKFKEAIRFQVDKIYPYLCVLNPKNNRNFSIRHGNSVNISDVFSEYEGGIDLLITSPPYATALPYLDTDRLSLIALGLLPKKQLKDTELQMVGTREVTERQRVESWEYYEKRKSELPATVTHLIDEIAKYNHTDIVGFRRKNLPALLGRYYLSMLDAMRSAHKLMKPGSFGYYVVGNNSTTINDKKIEIPTDEFLYDIGELAGWYKQEVIPMELISSRDIFRNNRGSSEVILCFRA